MNLIYFSGFATLWLLLSLYILGLLIRTAYGLISRYRWNPFRKPEFLSGQERQLLLGCFPSYKKMSDEHKLRFEKRTLWFRRAKEFKFKGVVTRQEDLKLVVAASLALLTMGLKNYRYMNSLEEIAIYPNRYFSRITRQHHFGEYNPTFNRVIISAEQFWKGFEITDDNRNLAMHEFAHALSFDFKRQAYWEGIRFSLCLKHIKKLFKQPTFSARLSKSSYFREYGLTNLQEFFAVAVENYIETPDQFKKEFPELYPIIKRMLAFEYT